MSVSRQRVGISVPASSANLGPGFDALGLALELRDELTVEAIDRGVEIVVSGEGAGTVPLDDSHLVVRSMNAAFDLLGERPPGVRLTCVNRVPHARGLGSSSAAIVGGIALARALVDGGVDRLDDLAAFQLATDLEGHPDNVAAAQFGGLTIAWMEGGAAAVERLDAEVGVTVFIPPDGVSTQAARGLLPESVPFADAAFNAGRSALMVAALTGAPHRLIAATEDRLHQGARSPAMPASYQLLRSLRVDGVAAVISGAGPTVLAFADGLSAATPEGWTSAELAVAHDGVAPLQPA